MNEFDIIKKSIKPVQNTQVVMGPGDDCSVVYYDDSNYLISSTDCLVEGVHFRLSDFNIEDLAYKALAVNISDISAMGGRPYWVHLTLAIPAKVSEEEVAKFMASFNDVCAEQNISLLGGDLSSSTEKLFINLHISGLVSKKNIQWRSHFVQGDLLCVTGPLGDSAAGLFAFLNNENFAEAKVLKMRHQKPVVQNDRAQWLAVKTGVYGMIDLSDGLLSDLKRIENTSFDIQLEKIPQSKELLVFCEKLKLDPMEYSLAGGEDYRIMFGCVENQYEKLLKAYEDKFGEPFFMIGRKNQQSKKTTWFEGGVEVDPSFNHFSHFS